MSMLWTYIFHNFPLNHLTLLQKVLRNGKIMKRILYNSDIFWIRSWFHSIVSSVHRPFSTFLNNIRAETRKDATKNEYKSLPLSLSNERSLYHLQRAIQLIVHRWSLVGCVSHLLFGWPLNDRTNLLFDLTRRKTLSLTHTRTRTHARERNQYENETERTHTQKHWEPYTKRQPRNLLNGNAYRRIVDCRTYYPRFNECERSTAYVHIERIALIQNYISRKVQHKTE